MTLKKFKTTLIVFLALNLFFPSPAIAKVSINEVAWMGNSESQYGEWIELYNDGTEAVDLKDAVLYEASGDTVVIKLTKSIQPGGYYLIARSTPSMPDPVGGLADDLGSFGGSGLSNSGESLVLKSASGGVIDTLDASSGWPAGDSASKLTMQRSGLSWITATATPRTANSSEVNITQSEGGTNTTAPSGSGGSLSQTTGNLSAHSSPSGLSEMVEEVKIMANAGRSRLALVDTPVIFEGRLFNNKLERVDGGNAFWSFGDGQTASGRMVSHSYKFPGDYLVVMNVLSGSEEYVARTSVKVVLPGLSIIEAGSDFVKIRNNSSYEANLGGWRISTGRQDFFFPKDTIIAERGDLTIPIETLGFVADFDQVELFTPLKKNIAKFKIKKSEDIKNHNVIKAVMPESVNQVAVPVSLSQLEQKLIEARRELEGRIVKTKVTAKVSGAETKVEISASSTTKDLDIQKTSDVVEVIDKPQSFFRDILGAPVSGFRYLKGLIF